MKIKITMIMDVEADSVEEAEEIIHEWNDGEFMEAMAEADLSIEAA